MSWATWPCRLRRENVREEGARSAFGFSVLLLSVKIVFPKIWLFAGGLNYPTSTISPIKNRVPRRSSNLLKLY